MQKRFTGFTLIEILVTIAIVGMLLSFLIPAIGESRERARRALCANNLRQIYVALNLYADDNEGSYPPDVLPGDPITHRTRASSTAFSYLYPKYTDDFKILWCPSYGTTQDSYPRSNSLFIETNYDYITNSTIDFPAERLLALDTLNYRAENPNHEWQSFSNHKGRGGNMLFCGGHVKWINGSDPDKGINIRYNIGWIGFLSSGKDSQEDVGP